MPRINRNNQCKCKDCKEETMGEKFCSLHCRDGNCHHEKCECPKCDAETPVTRTHCSPQCLNGSCLHDKCGNPSCNKFVVKLKFCSKECFYKSRKCQCKKCERILKQGVKHKHDSIQCRYGKCVHGLCKNQGCECQKLPFSDFCSRQCEAEDNFDTYNIEICDDCQGEWRGDGNGGCRTCFYGYVVGDQ